jgi:hypothetical protein
MVIFKLERYSYTEPEFTKEVCEEVLNDGAECTGPRNAGCVLQRHAPTMPLVDATPASLRDTPSIISMLGVIVAQQARDASALRFLKRKTQLLNFRNFFFKNSNSN